jgi:hypothetical protein
MSKKVEVKPEAPAHQDGEDLNHEVKTVPGRVRGGDTGPTGPPGTDPSQDPPSRGM